MLMLDTRSISWWYWLVSAILLTAGMCERSLIAFPIQVRLAYLLLLLIALPENLQWLYWIPTIGTWAQVLFGYCAMARAVSLLPWNRKQPFSFALLEQTFLSAPVRGNILQGLPPVPRNHHA